MTEGVFQGAFRQFEWLTDLFSLSLPSKPDGQRDSGGKKEWKEIDRKIEINRDGNKDRNGDKDKEKCEGSCRVVSNLLNFRIHELQVLQI